MNTDKHTVTIPIADYNKMLETKQKLERFKDNIENRIQAMKKAGVYCEGLNFDVDYQDCIFISNTMINSNATVKFVTPKQKQS